MQLRISNIPDCCGALIIYGFSYAYDGEWKTVKQLKIELKELSIFFKNRAIVLIILNEGQKEKLSNLLEEFEFILLTKTYNSGSRKNIYLYIRDRMDLEIYGEAK